MFGYIPSSSEWLTMKAQAINVYEEVRRLYFRRLGRKKEWRFRCDSQMEIRGLCAFGKCEPERKIVTVSSPSGPEELQSTVIHEICKAYDAPADEHGKGRG